MGILRIYTSMTDTYSSSTGMNCVHLLHSRSFVLSSIEWGMTVKLSGHQISLSLVSSGWWSACWVSLPLKFEASCIGFFFSAFPVDLSRGLFGFLLLIEESFEILLGLVI